MGSLSPSGYISKIQLAYQTPLEQAVYDKLIAVATSYAVEKVPHSPIYPIGRVLVCGECQGAGVGVIPRTSKIFRCTDCGGIGYPLTTRQQVVG